MAYTQTYAYPGREDREGGYADLSGKNTFENQGHQAMFGSVHHQQQPYQHHLYQPQHQQQRHQVGSRDRFYDQHQYQAQQQQVPGYPSYAPYVSDEERVLALLSSSSSDNLRGLESNLGGIMSNSHKTQYAGNDSVDWYGSPYAYPDERYLDQAREVDLDVYHHRQQDGMRQGGSFDASETAAVAGEGYRSWADLGHGQKASEEDEDDFPSAYKPAAAFQPFAEEEVVMEDDYEYGEDEYDGQNQLSRSQTLQEGHGSFSSGCDFASEPVAQQQQQEVGTLVMTEVSSTDVPLPLSRDSRLIQVVPFTSSSPDVSDRALGLHKYSTLFSQLPLPSHRFDRTRSSRLTTGSFDLALAPANRVDTLQMAVSNPQAMPFQQQYAGEYYGNDQYPYTKASHLPRGGVANPFGAVGSETLRFDSVSRQSQEQVSMEQQAYSLAHVGGKTGYEAGGFVQDAGAQFEQQAMQFEQPVVEEVAITSGVGLSGWLAEAVWQLCMVPFEPIGDKHVATEYVLDKATRFTVNSVLTYLCPDYSATFANEMDFAHYSPQSRNWSGFSSPDVVSYRELYDASSGYASPVIGSPSSRFASNPFGLRSKPSQAFVEFVHRTLSQTLLSPTAVVLSLWYIKRLAVHSGGGADGIMLRQMLHRSVSDMNGCGGEEAVQRILTLGLACSNKWLDDNTFTNKSWSDVTLLPLAEINSLELYALGPLKFDLSISVMEWDEWLYTVNQGLTPFVTDGLAVASAINAMRQALAFGNTKFENDIVSRRNSAVDAAAVAEYDAVHPVALSNNSPNNSMILPPIGSVVDARHLHGSAPYGMAEYGSSALDFGSQSYGRVNNEHPEVRYPGKHNAGYGYPSSRRQHRRGSVLPPVASTLPPPQMASSVYPSSSVRGQARRERIPATASNHNNASSSSSSGLGFVNQGDGSVYPSYTGHQYYLSHLASSHQPRFMSVMA